MSELFRSALGYLAPQNGGANTENEGFVGETVNLPDRKLKIIKLVAEGGFSYVFQGQDERTGQLMAIKRILTPDAESTKAVEEEINFMRNLNHKNIIKFYGSIKSNMEHLIIMEFCRIPLPQLPLAFNHVGQVFSQTCRAIEYLHNFGIVHRDVKLENILIGDDGVVKLVDFGSATLEKFIPTNEWTASRRNIVEESIAQKTTPMYRSPEMLDLWLNYPIDQRADLWALGCLLFTLCYNSHPFQDSNKLAIVNANYIIPKNDTTYTPYAQIIRGLLKVDPTERMDFNGVFEILSSIAESKEFSLSGKLPFRPPVAAPPQPPPQSAPHSASEQPATYRPGGGSLFSSIRGGAENIFKNIKESSQKYISSVPFPTNVNGPQEERQPQLRQDSQYPQRPPQNIPRKNSFENQRPPQRPPPHHHQEERPPPIPSHKVVPPQRPKPPGPLVENLLGLSIDEGILPPSGPPPPTEPVSSAFDAFSTPSTAPITSSHVDDLLGDFLVPNIQAPQPPPPSNSMPTNRGSNWGGNPSNLGSGNGKLDLLGDPFDSIGISQPTLVNSTSFHDLSARTEKMVKNTSTPNLSDLILDDIMATSKNQAQTGQAPVNPAPPTIKPTPVNPAPIINQQEQNARANYNRQFFIGEQPEKKTDLNGFFGDLLNEQGFSASSSKTNGNKTINAMRKVELEREMDPMQFKVNEWREGKKKNIRALLSSLHTVVWSSCHWEETNMSQMVTPAQVKKVYRKACLSIHPDKQMGAEHEELAKMIFVELNEAWAAFEEAQS